MKYYINFSVPGELDQAAVVTADEVAFRRRPGNGAWEVVFRKKVNDQMGEYIILTVCEEPDTAPRSVSFCPNCEKFLRHDTRFCPLFPDEGYKKWGRCVCLVHTCYNAEELRGEE